MRPAVERFLFFAAGALAAAVALRAPVTSVALAAATPPATPTPTPGLWDRALGGLSDTAGKYTSDEAIADYVAASVQKQERVNRILEQRGSRYRISELHVDIGVAPALEVAITESAPPAPAPAAPPAVTAPPEGPAPAPSLP